MIVSDILPRLNTYFCGVMLPLVLIGMGVYLSLRLRFIQIRGVRQFLLAIFQKKDRALPKKNSLSVWESVSTSLGSTIGTGSIVGIGAAIKLGGPGSVFWMWVSAFLGMAIKFTEIVLSMRYRQKNSAGFFVGGPMYYLKFGLGSKFLSVCFCLFCICACFGMGNAVQANAISSSLHQRFSIHSFFSACILTTLVGFVILGGAKRIGAFSAKLVPLMSLVYIGCCVLIVVLNFQKIPGIFRSIFCEAFSVPSVVGGVSSYGIFQAMKQGFSKGIFSNEAGLGSAPIAHGSSEDDDCFKQGFFGIFEVFFTTVVICTLTAFVVLSSKLYDQADTSATMISYLAFDALLPNFGGICICISILLFSLSSIIGWGFYGEVCLEFLFCKKRTWIVIYRILFVLAVFVGSVGNVELIWNFSETANAFMAFANLIGVAFLSEEVVRIISNSK